jgi:hypothetical protein
MSVWIALGLAALFAGGYVASIYTWPKIRDEYVKLRAGLDKLGTKF